MRTLGMVSLAMCATIVTAAHATEMYQWIDAEGRMHVADVVPPEYLKTAKRIESRQFDLSPAEKLAADRQAAALKAQSDRVDRRLDVAQRATRTVAKASEADASPTNPQQCADRWRRYREAQSCFTSRTRRNGTIEPMRTCDPEAQDPTPACGPERPST